MSQADELDENTLGFASQIQRELCDDLDECILAIRKTAAQKAMAGGAR